MNKPMTLLAVGAALIAAPALAQLNVGGNANVGGAIGANPVKPVGDVTERVTDRVGHTVDRVDGAVNESVDNTNLTLATREQVRAGAELTDTRGNSIGTVHSVDGGTAVVVRGGKLYNVPLSSIYQKAAGGATRLVTKLSKSEISARVAADAEVRNR